MPRGKFRVRSSPHWLRVPSKQAEAACLYAARAAGRPAALGLILIAIDATHQLFVRFGNAGGHVVDDHIESASLNCPDPKYTVAAANRYTARREIAAALDRSESGLGREYPAPRPRIFLPIGASTDAAL